MRIRNQRIEPFETARLTMHLVVGFAAAIGFLILPAVLSGAGAILGAVGSALICAWAFYWIIGAPEARNDEYQYARKAAALTKAARRLRRSPYLKHNPIADAVTRDLKTQAMAIHSTAVSITTDAAKDVDTPQTTSSRREALSEGVSTMEKALQALRDLRDEERALLGDQAKKRDTDQEAVSAAEATSENLRLLTEQINGVKTARASLRN